jgi:hypothetical protein
MVARLGGVTASAFDRTSGSRLEPIAGAADLNAVALDASPDHSR